jgi:hypothetical protein
MLEVIGRTKAVLCVSLFFSVCLHWILSAATVPLLYSSSAPRVTHALKVSRYEQGPKTFDAAPSSTSDGTVRIDAERQVTKAEPQNPDTTTYLAVSLTTNDAGNIFLSINEVTSPAVPIDDWHLPLDDVARAGVHQMSFRVFVMASGQIAKVQLNDILPYRMDTLLMQKIVDMLATTPMKPAKLEQQFVPSERNIELVFTRD